MTVMKPRLGKQWHVLEVTTPHSGLSGYNHSQLKTQTHEASIPTLLFLEDVKVSYVGGFFREDNFVFSEDKSSAFLYEADSNPKPQTAGTCSGFNDDLVILNSWCTTEPYEMII